MDDRLVWLDNLDASACWMKAPWERDVGHRMLKLMEQDYSRITPFCAPETVYGVVHNYYFLSQFACYEYSELADKLRLVRAMLYLWHDLFFLRRRRLLQVLAQEEAEIAEKAKEVEGVEEDHT
jgi:hypothetical protein